MPSFFYCEATQSLTAKRRNLRFLLVERSGRAQGLYRDSSPQGRDKREDTVDRRYRINSYIRVPQVRLIDADGTQVGITPIQDAMKRAQERGMDLVEISGASNPPVCKIIDFPKFRYEQEKKEREARKKQKGGGLLKEIRVRVRISDHDLETKLKHAREFIGENNKVQATVVFMGREMQHRDLGMKLLLRIAETLADISDIEQRPNLLGNRLSITLMPKKLIKK